MEAVDGIGGDGKGGVEAEGDVGHGDIVVDGFGQGDHVDPSLGQAVGVLLGAAAADADYCFEVVAMIVVDHHLGHVLHLGADRHLVRLVAAGAEDGAAEGEDAGEDLAFQVDGPVLHEAAETVAEADHLHVVGIERALANGPDGRIEPGAVTAGGQHADTFSHVISYGRLELLSWVRENYTSLADCCLLLVPSLTEPERIQSHQIKRS